MFRIRDMVDESVGWTDACSVMAPRQNVWNFVAVSYNYRTRMASLYINGLLAGKYSPAPLLGEPLRIILGGDVYQNSFKGIIADLKIYNQELSPIEILYEFNEFE